MRICRPGGAVSNGLQTNGLLLDGAWAGFLAKEGFSVGLSMDGPAELHDAFRRSADGGATHARVEQACRLLRKRGVFVNCLCVLHARNTPQPDVVYDYFRGLGATHIQFLPFVAAHDGVGFAAAEPRAIGEFLCRVFDRWIAEDVGRIVIQNIDEALRPIYGLPHALCVHRETCGEVAVLERDGGFYACDHFVDADHLIGNLRETPLDDLANDARMVAFGNAKRDTLPRIVQRVRPAFFVQRRVPEGSSPRRDRGGRRHEPALSRLQGILPARHAGADTPRGAHALGPAAQGVRAPRIMSGPGGLRMPLRILAGAFRCAGCPVRGCAAQFFRQPRPAVPPREGPSPA